LRNAVLRLKFNAILALAALLAIGTALWQLRAARAGVVETRLDIGRMPATIFRPADGARHPVVVIAHGFAGSQQLMRSFALCFARNGYIAVTFDFPGHGRNPDPLTGSITDENGATRALVAAVATVADVARGLGDGRLAVLGHSMASDVVVRFAEQSPDVAATIAVSMFSPVVTAAAPRDLLVIVGAWEGPLKREALRAVGLATAPTPARAFVTYGNPAAGTARRVAFSAHVEHASVLFSEQSLRESLAWLDACFQIERTSAPRIDARGLDILLLFAGIVALARPLSRTLPRVCPVPVGANLRWRRLWLPLLLPMLATPLVLRFLPTHFLPVLVGDYLAVHYAVYGLFTLLGWLWVRRRGADRLTTPAARPAVSVPALAAAAVLVIAFGFIAIVWPLNSFVTSFVPGPSRLLLIAAMGVGTSAYFLSDEWLTRGMTAARGAYPASKLAFLVSLVIAVGLDLEHLFFLIIIVPIIALFLIVYGSFSGWIYRRTRHPWVAAIANAVAFAWAIGVTFPLLSG
jgi:pimeloyl-ACP methyl ester carboxylesterase